MKTDHYDMSNMNPNRKLNGYPRQLTRAMFYLLGGFANPDLFRKAVGASWTYWRL